MKEQEQTARQKAIREIMDTDPRAIPGYVKRQQYGKFDYIAIEQMQEVFAAIVGDYETHINKIDVTDIGGKFTVTVWVAVHFVCPFSASNKQLHGIATEQQDGKQQVGMIAPKAKSEAFKNAVSDYCRVLGRGLRRKDGTTAADIKKVITAISKKIEGGKDA